MSKIESRASGVGRVHASNGEVNLPRLDRVIDRVVTVTRPTFVERTRKDAWDERLAWRQSLIVCLEAILREGKFLSRTIA